jgi:prevent-host-death family protein
MARTKTTAAALEEELESVPATEAKNSFGAVLDKVMAKGKIAITKHEEVRAVVLSLSEYQTLLAKQHDPLNELEREFEDLVVHMQKPAAARAGRALFDATPARLGRAAVAAARRRG